MSTTALSPQIWKIIIFVVDGIDNHCGLDIPNIGLADCSLAGARVIDWEHRSIPKGEQASYDVLVKNPTAALEFARRPGTLTYPIIAQEKRQRGWHLTPAAPDFVRTLRSNRSRDPDDLNCVEWLWCVLEAGGVEVPDDVLTPRELRAWCIANTRARMRSAISMSSDRQEEQS
jgi:hypothetical protein